jgi:hypothetical protein
MPDDLSGFALGSTETTIEIDPNGGVIIKTPSNRRSRGQIRGFSENLAKRDGIDLHGIAAELLEGFEADLKSRQQFSDSYESALDLLGLEIKDDRKEKTSQVGHPLLLEAIVRAQSAAGAELLPSSGPCKVETPGGSDAQSDALAQAFQDDMNAYLTSGAPEYYPDTDRGLFGLFYSGNMFKKVYNHPLRRRPVSECVSVEDLIVSEDATDFETALRVAHRSQMTTQMVTRMQRYGDWRDCDLGNAQPRMDALNMAQERITGVSGLMSRPQDIPHEILEITADLDLSDYGVDLPGLPDIPVTYVVTLDKLSQQVLAVRRGWIEDDECYRRRQRYVHYGMVPSFGFLCLGFMHLLANQTKALRGIWRLLVTSGMYANSPGGMKAKGIKMGVSDIRPGPGEWPDIDIGSFDDIRKCLMPMPYKDVSTQFMELAQAVAADANRLAGVIQTEVGEGLSNVPVGTMMSMIEVGTQTMSAVHKRLHRAQARELQLIKDCFVENPDALSRLPSAAHPWSRAAEFDAYNLIPASDPNVPSQIHRIQLATALVTVASQNPDLYDRPAVHMRAWRTIGVNDPQAFVLPQPAQGPPQGGAAPPDPLIGQARLIEAQAKIQQVQQNQVDMRRKAAEAEAQSQYEMRKQQAEEQTTMAELASRERIAQQQTQIEQLRLQIEQQRMDREHQREVHHGALDAVTKGYVADRQEAIQRHKSETDAETARHVAKVQAQSAITAAKSRPKPAAKPSGNSKK